MTFDPEATAVILARHLRAALTVPFAGGGTVIYKPKEGTLPETRGVSDYDRTDVPAGAAVIVVQPFMRKQLLDYCDAILAARQAKQSETPKEVPTP